MMNNEKLVTYSELCILLNRNYKTIWAWCKKGEFPQPVKVLGRTIGWKKTDVDLWLSNHSQKENAQ